MKTLSILRKILASKQSTYQQDITQLELSAIKLRGGGCGQSTDQAVSDQKQLLPLPSNFAKDLKEYTNILKEHAIMLLDQNAKDEVYIAIQWFYFNSQHLNTLCFNHRQASYVYELILQCLEDLLNSCSLYLRASGLLCMYILQICNDLMRVVFSFLLKDRNNKNRYLEFNYKEQLEKQLNKLQDQIGEQENVWVTGVLFEIAVLNIAIIHCPTDATKKEELFSQFLNGMFESIFQLSPSEGLIKSLIDIGSSIVIDKYNKHFKHKLRKYEIYYFFITLKWSIINQLRLEHSVEQIFVPLENGYVKYVMNSNDWYIHYCWINMISDLISFRPIVEKVEKSDSAFKKNQWDILIQNKQLSIFPYDKNQGRVLFRETQILNKNSTSANSQINNDAYLQFYKLLINQRCDSKIKLWKDYIQFSFQNDREMFSQEESTSINKLIFGNFEVLRFQLYIKYILEIHHDLIQSAEKICQKLNNFMQEPKIEQDILKIYINEIEFHLTTLKQKLNAFIELIIRYKFLSNLLTLKCQHLTKILQSHKEQLKKKETLQNDVKIKKKQLRDDSLIDALKYILKQEVNQQQNVKQIIQLIQKVIFAIALLEDEKQQFFFYSEFKQFTFSFQKVNLKEIYPKLQEMKRLSEDIQSKIFVTQKINYKFFNKNFQYEKYNLSFNQQNFITEIFEKLTEFFQNTFHIFIMELGFETDTQNPFAKIQSNLDCTKECCLNAKQFLNNCQILAFVILILDRIMNTTFHGLIELFYFSLNFPNNAFSINQRREESENSQFLRQQEEEIFQIQKLRIINFFVAEVQPNKTQLIQIINEFQKDFSIQNNYKKLLKQNNEEKKNLTQQTIQYFLSIYHQNQEDNFQQKKQLIFKLYSIEQDELLQNVQSQQQEKGQSHIKQTICQLQTGQPQIKMVQMQDQVNSKLHQQNDEAANLFLFKQKEIKDNQKVLIEQPKITQCLEKISQFELLLQAIISYFSSTKFGGTLLDEQLEKEIDQIRVAQQINFNEQYSSLRKELNSFSFNLISFEQNNDSQQLKIPILSIKRFFDSLSCFSNNEDISNCDEKKESLISIIQEQLDKSQNKNFSQNDHKVREGLVFNVIKIQSLVPETQFRVFCEKIIYDIWGRERDIRVKQLLQNQEMINLQKKMYSQNLKFFVVKLKEDIEGRLAVINQLEQQVNQEKKQNNKEEKRKKLIQEYQEFDRYIDGITEMASKLDIGLVFLKQIRMQLTKVSEKIDKISIKISELGNDIKKIQGQNYLELLQKRKNTVLEQQQQIELRNIYIPLKTQEWNVQTGYKIGNETYLLSDQITDTEAEVNEFLFLEKDKDVLLIRGNAGSGKSRAAKKIEEMLWKQKDNFDETNEKWIPIFISLPSIREPRYNLIQQALESDYYHFNQIQIKDFKEAIKLHKLNIVLILESYDELNSEIISQNLYLTNNLSLEFEVHEKMKVCKLKMIYTTRNEILTVKSYRTWFSGLNISTLKEIELLPFNQIQSEEYITSFSILNVKRLFLELYENYLLQNNQKFYAKDFLTFWELAYCEINSDQNLNLQLNLLLSQRSVEILIEKAQTLFEGEIQDQIPILIKELSSLWSSKNFFKIISIMNIQQIINTPFMLEIVVQVLPSMIQSLSQIPVLKVHFFQNYNQIRLQYEKSKFLQNQYQKKQYYSIYKPHSHETLNKEAKLSWGILEKENFFLHFSVNTNFRMINEYGIQITNKNCIENCMEILNNQYGQDTIVILQIFKKLNLTNYDFYDKFVSFYYEKQIQKLQQRGVKFNYDSLCEDLFNYSQNLALDLTKRQLTQVSYLQKGRLKKFTSNNNNFWEEYYFNDTDGEQGYKSIIRSCCLITQKNNHFQFTHKSIQEFFVAKYFIDLIKKMKIIEEEKLDIFMQYLDHDKNETQEKQKNINQQLNKNDYSEIWQQLIENIRDGYLNSNEFNLSLKTFYGCITLMKTKLQNIKDYKEIMLQQIQLSKNNQFIQSASNCFFLLSQMNEYFGNQDFRGIQIANSNVKGATFYNAKFQNSHFSNVDINYCNFNKANLEEVQWENIILEQEKKFEGHQSKINDIIQFQQNFAVSAGDDANIIIWDLRSSTKIHMFRDHQGKVYKLELFDGETKLASVSEDQFLIIYQLKQDNFMKLLSWKFTTPIYSIISYQLKNTYFQVTQLKNIIIIYYDQDTLQLVIQKNLIFNEEISAFAISSQQSLRAIAFGNIIKVETLKGLEIQSEYAGYQDQITILSFFSQGNFLASGSIDGQVIVLNIKDRSMQNIISRNQNSIISISLLNNQAEENQILCFAAQKQIFIWDTQANKFLNTIDCNKQIITATQLIKINNQIHVLYGCSDNHIRSACIERDNEKRDNDAHESDVTTLSISPDGLFVAPGSRHNEIKIWNVETGQLKIKLSQHQSGIRKLKYSNNGKLLASFSDDSVLTLWETNFYHRISNVQTVIRKTINQSFIIKIQMNQFENEVEYVLDHNIQALVSLNDCQGFSLAIGTSKGKLLAIVNEKVQLLYTDSNPICVIDFTEVLQNIGFGNPNGTVKIYSLSNKQIIQIIDTQAPILVLRLFKDTTEFLSGHSKGILKQYSYFETDEKQQKIQQWFLGNENIFSIQIEKKSYALVGTSNCQIYKISFKNREQICFNENLSYSIIELSNSGNYLATANGIDLFLWTIKSQSCIKFNRSHSDKISALGFSIDDQILASGSTNIISLYAISDTSRTLGTCYGINSSIQKLDFCNEGNFLISIDKTDIRIWDINEFEQIFRIQIASSQEDICMVKFNKENSCAIIQHELNSNLIQISTFNIDLHNFVRRVQIDINSFVKIDSASISKSDHYLAIANSNNELLLINCENLKVINSIKLQQPIKKIQISYFFENVFYIQMKDALIALKYHRDQNQIIEENSKYIINQCGDILTSFSKYANIMAFFRKSELAVINLKTLEQSYIFQNKETSISAFAICPNQQFFAVGKINGLIAVWNIANEFFQYLELNQNRIIFLNFIDSNTLLSIGCDGKIIMIQINTKSQCRESFSQTGKNKFQLAIICNNLTLHLVQSQNLVFDELPNPFNICFSANDEMLAVIQNQGQEANIEQISKSIIATAIAFSNDDGYFSFGDNQMNISLIQKNSKKQFETTKLSKHNSIISALNFYQQEYLVSGSIDMSVCIWNLRSKDLKIEINLSIGQISCLSCSQISPTVAISGQNNQIVIMNLINQIYDTLEAHTSKINALEISPCGAVLVSGSDDQCIKLWKLDKEEVDIRNIQAKYFLCYKTIGAIYPFEANYVKINNQNSKIIGIDGEDLRENFM